MPEQAASPSDEVRYRRMHLRSSLFGSRRLFMLKVILCVAAISLLSVVAVFASTVVQVYECPECQKVAQYAEAGYRTHYCTGTAEEPHSKRIMNHIGEQRVNDKD